jgi:hypothetical protein
LGHLIEQLPAIEAFERAHGLERTA